MKKFADFIKEAKLFRGHMEEDGIKGESPFVWFAYKDDLAYEYKKLRGDDAVVSTINYTPKKSVKFGTDKDRMWILDFLDRIVQQSGNYPSKECYVLKDKLVTRYGVTEYEIHQFWYKDQAVADFIDLMGFDSIVCMEGNVKTIGINRKYL